MRTSIPKLTQIVASVAILLAAFATPAAARFRHYHGHRPVRHPIHHRIAARPLTVRRYYRDPFHGPAAIITAPVTIAGMIVSLPFRAVAAVFPPYGNPAANPLVLVGAPVHAAGEIAQLPFFAVDSAFGVSPNYYYHYYY